MFIIEKKKSMEINYYYYLTRIIVHGIAKEASDTGLAYMISKHISLHHWVQHKSILVLKKTLLNQINELRIYMLL